MPGRKHLTQDDYDTIVLLWTHDQRNLTKICDVLDRPGGENAVAQVLKWYGLRQIQSRSHYRTWHPPEEYMKHYHHYRKRYIGNQDPNFPYTLKGFLAWVEHIGPIPDGMHIPSVGRKDHSKGYVKGNFEWQSMADNVAERNVRNPKPIQSR